MPSVNRRAVLAGAAASGVMALFGGCVSASGPAAARRGFFARTGRPIGLQLYTLGDEVASNLEPTLASVAAIGYRELELPNLYGRPPREIRAAADRAGLAISSLHLGVSTLGKAAGLTLTSPPEEIAEALGVLGARRAVVPISLFPAGFRTNPGEDPKTAIGRAFAAAGADPWQRTAALMNERAALLKPLGISVGYHNHNMEFRPIGATTGWDIMVAEWDPALVDFEIDIGWVAAAGLDPVAFLNRHKGRVRQLHVKDVAAGHTPNYTLSLTPTEVGSGTVDWARVLPAAWAAGARHFYVEQEPPFVLPRLESIRRSYAFLGALRA